MNQADMDWLGTQLDTTNISDVSQIKIAQNKQYNAMHAMIEEKRVLSDQHDKINNLTMMLDKREKHLSNRELALDERDRLMMSRDYAFAGQDGLDLSIRSAGASTFDHPEFTRTRIYGLEATVKQQEQQVEHTQKGKNEALTLLQREADMYRRRVEEQEGDSTKTQQEQFQLRKKSKVLDLDQEQRGEVQNRQEQLQREYHVVEKKQDTANASCSAIQEEYDVQTHNYNSLLKKMSVNKENMALQQAKSVIPEEQAVMMQRELDNMQHNLDQTQKKLEYSAKQRQQLEDKYKSLEADTAEQVGSLQRARVSEVRKLEQKTEDQEGKNSKLVDQLKKMTTAMEAFQTEHRQVQEQAETVFTELGEYKFQLKVAETERAQCVQTIEHLEEKIDYLEGTLLDEKRTVEESKHGQSELGLRLQRMRADKEKNQCSFKDMETAVLRQLGGKSVRRDEAVLDANNWARLVDMLLDLHQKQRISDDDILMLRQSCHFECQASAILRQALIQTVMDRYHLEEVCKDSEVKIQSHARKLKKALDELLEAETREKEATMKYTEERDVVERKSKEIESLSIRIDELQASRKNQSGLIQQLEVELRTKEQEVEELDVLLVEAQKQNKDVTTETGKKTEQIQDELHRSLLASQSKQELLDSVNTQQKVAAANQKGMEQDLDRARKELDSTNTKLHGKIADLELERDGLLQTNNTLKTDNEELESEYKKVQIVQTSQKDRLALVSSQLDETRHTLSSKETFVAQLQQEVEKQTGLEVQYESKKKDLESKSTKLQALQTEIVAVSTQLLQVTSEKESVDGLVKTLRHENAILKQNKEEAYQLSVSQQNQVDLLNSRIHELENQVVVEKHSKELGENEKQHLMQSLELKKKLLEENWMQVREEQSKLHNLELAVSAKEDVLNSKLYSLEQEKVKLSALETRLQHEKTRLEEEQAGLHTRHNNQGTRESVLEQREKQGLAETQELERVRLDMEQELEDREILLSNERQDVHILQGQLQTIQLNMEVQRQELNQKEQGLLQMREQLDRDAQTMQAQIQGHIDTQMKKQNMDYIKKIERLHQEIEQLEQNASHMNQMVRNLSARVKADDQRVEVEQQIHTGLEEGFHPQNISRMQTLLDQSSKLHDNRMKQILQMLLDESQRTSKTVEYKKELLHMKNVAQELDILKQQQIQENNILKFKLTQIQQSSEEDMQYQEQEMNAQCEMINQQTQQQLQTMKQQHEYMVQQLAAVEKRQVEQDSKEVQLREYEEERNKEYTQWVQDVQNKYHQLYDNQALKLTLAENGLVKEGVELTEIYDKLQNEYAELRRTLEEDYIVKIEQAQSTFDTMHEQLMEQRKLIRADAGKILEEAHLLEQQQITLNQKKLEIDLLEAQVLHEKEKQKLVEKEKQVIKGLEKHVHAKEVELSTKEQLINLKLQELDEKEDTLVKDIQLKLEVSELEAKNILAEQVKQLEVERTQQYQRSAEEAEQVRLNQDTELRVKREQLENEYVEKTKLLQSAVERERTMIQQQYKQDLEANLSEQSQHKAGQDVECSTKLKEIETFVKDNLIANERAELQRLREVESVQQQKEREHVEALLSKLEKEKLDMHSKLQGLSLKGGDLSQEEERLQRLRVDQEQRLVHIEARERDIWKVDQNLVELKNRLESAEKAQQQREVEFHQVVDAKNREIQNIKEKLESMEYGINSKYLQAIEDYRHKIQELEQEYTRKHEHLDHMHQQWLAEKGVLTQQAETLKHKVYLCEEEIGSLKKINESSHIHQNGASEIIKLLETQYKAVVAELETKLQVQKTDLETKIVYITQAEANWGITKKDLTTQVGLLQNIADQANAEKKIIEEKQSQCIEDIQIYNTTRIHMDEDDEDMQELQTCQYMLEQVVQEKEAAELKLSHLQEIHQTEEEMSQELGRVQDQYDNLVDKYETVLLELTEWRKIQKKMHEVCLVLHALGTDPSLSQKKYDVLVEVYDYFEKLQEQEDNPHVALLLPQLAHFLSNLVYIEHLQTVDSVEEEHDSTLHLQNTNVILKDKIMTLEKGKVDLQDMIESLHKELDTKDLEKENVQVEYTKLTELCHTLEQSMAQKVQELSSTHTLAQQSIQNEKLQLLETLETKNSELVTKTHEIDAKNNEIEAKDRELVTKNAVVESQLSQLQDITEENQGLHTQLALVNGTNTDLQSKLSTLELSLFTIQEKYSSLEVSYHSVKHAKQCLQEDKDELKGIFDQIKDISKDEKLAFLQQIADLQVQLEVLQNGKAQLDAEVSDQQDKVDTIVHTSQLEKEACVKHVNSLQLELETTHTQQKEYTLRCTALETEVQTLYSVQKEMEKGNNTIRKELDEVCVDYKNSREELNRVVDIPEVGQVVVSNITSIVPQLQGIMVRLKNMLEQANTEKCTLQGELATLQQAESALQAKLVEVESSLKKELVQLNSTFREEWKSQEDQFHEKYTSTVEGYDMRILAYEKDLTAQKEQNDVLQGTNQDLLTKYHAYEALKTDHAALHDHISTLEGHLSTVNANVSKIQQELDSAHLSEENNQLKLQVLSSEVDHLQGEQTLLRKLELDSRDIHSIVERNAHLSQLTDDYRAEMSEMMVREDVLRGEMKKVQGILDTTRMDLEEQSQQCANNYVKKSEYNIIAEQLERAQDSQSLLRKKCEGIEFHVQADQEHQRMVLDVMMGFQKKMNTLLSELPRTSNHVARLPQLSEALDIMVDEMSAVLKHEDHKIVRIILKHTQDVLSTVRSSIQGTHADQAKTEEALVLEKKTILGQEKDLKTNYSSKENDLLTRQLLLEEERLQYSVGLDTIRKKETQLDQEMSSIRVMKQAVDQHDSHVKELQGTCLEQQKQVQQRAYVLEKQALELEHANAALLEEKDEILRQMKKTQLKEDEVVSKSVLLEHKDLEVMQKQGNLDKQKAALEKDTLMLQEEKSRVDETYAHCVQILKKEKEVGALQQYLQECEDVQLKKSQEVDLQKMSVDSKQKELEQREKDVVQNEAHVSKLRTELECQQRELDGKQSAQKEQLKQLHSIEQSISKKEQEYVHVEAKYKELKTHVDSQNQQLKVLTNESSRLDGTLASLKQQKQEVDGTLVGERNTQHAVHTEQTQQQQQKIELQKEVATMQVSQQAAQVQADTLHSEEQQVRNILMQLQYDKTALLDTIQKLESEKASLMQNTDVLKQEEQGLLQSLATTGMDTHKKEKEYAHLISLIATKETELATLQQAVELCVDGLHGNRDVLVQLERSLYTQKQEDKEQKEKVSQLQLERVHIEQEMESKQHTLLELNAQLEDVDHQMQQQQTQQQDVAGKTKELEQQQQTVSVQQGQKSELQSTLSSLHKDHVELQSILADTMKDIDVLDGARASLQEALLSPIKGSARDDNNNMKSTVVQATMPTANMHVNRFEPYISPRDTIFNPIPVTQRTPQSNNTNGNSTNDNNIYVKTQMPTPNVYKRPLPRDPDAEHQKIIDALMALAGGEADESSSIEVFQPIAEALTQRDEPLPSAIHRLVQSPAFAAIDPVILRTYLDRIRKGDIGALRELLELADQHRQPEGGSSSAESFDRLFQQQTDTTGIATQVYIPKE